MGSLCCASWRVCGGILIEQKAAAVETTLLPLCERVGIAIEYLLRYTIVKLYFGVSVPIDTISFDALS